jgi:hypothetical protein
MRVQATNILMRDADDRQNLAEACIAFAKKPAS